LEGHFFSRVIFPQPFSLFLSGEEWVSFFVVFVFFFFFLFFFFFFLVFLILFVILALTFALVSLL